jgi:hypothetical protein
VVNFGASMAVRTRLGWEARHSGDGFGSVHDSPARTGGEGRGRTTQVYSFSFSSSSISSSGPLS